MFKSLLRLFKGTSPIPGRRSGYDGIIGDLVARLDVVELRLDEVAKATEAVRRKVYRDKAKTNGDDPPEVANTAPDRFPSPYL